ncbi:cyclophilin-like fold protein [Terrabacter sp. Ter38]|uniref:cyclophilin-like fold protein n=1 Tax=Terrabacter sp. Ter38 TaxID=2926030 RepID=UPI0021195EC8|nr:cyclophilin-like fold protein [Terrabacter sp. Ter38]
MRIQLTVNGAELTGTLGEGAAARDFAALLPLTVELADFHGRERVADLPRPLDLAGEPASTTAQPGDIAHYATWDNMALFYGNQHHAAGLVRLVRLVRLGRLDDPAARVLADLPESATAIVELAD